MIRDKCPVCGGEPGYYRYQTCSIACEVVTGEPTDIENVAVALVLLTALALYVLLGVVL